MANEFTLSSALSYVKNGIEPIIRAQAGKIVSQTGTGAIEIPELSVTTAEIAMQLGGLTTLGWCWFHNLDATNFIEIRAATAGTKIVKVPALTAVLFYFGSGVTAPYLIADTASCLCEYVLFKP